MSTNDMIFSVEYPIKPEHIDIGAIVGQLGSFDDIHIPPSVIASMIGLCQQRGHWTVMSFDEVLEFGQRRFGLHRNTLTIYWKENYHVFFELDLFTSKAMLMHGCIADNFKRFPSAKIKAARSQQSV